MWSAIIYSVSVRLGSDGQTVEVEAQVLEGRVEAGMSVVIELNRSTSLCVRIVCVSALDGNQIKLILDGEDREYASMIEAMNFADEVLLVTAAATQ